MALEGMLELLVLQKCGVQKVFR